MSRPVEKKILAYFCDRVLKDIPLKSLVKDLGEIKKIINEALYDLQRKNVLKKIWDTPPVWQVGDDFEQYCEQYDIRPVGKDLLAFDAYYEIAQAISSIISDNDIPALKNFFAETIDSKRCSSRISSVKELLDILNIRDSFGVSNLKAMGEILKKEEIIQLADKYKARFPKRCELCILPNELDNAINYVYPKIGPTWVHLARALGLVDHHVAIIKADYKSVKDQAYEALMLWRKKKGNKATMYDLIEALESDICERKDLADDLRNNKEYL